MTSNRAVLKGATAGLVGGLIASWVMNRFQAAVTPQSPGRDANAEDATMRVADAISDTVLHHHLTTDEKRIAGPVIHYLFGSGVGAAYGALAEMAPGSTMMLGLPFGAAVWLGADEIAVASFGLSKSPLAYPPSTHAMALASHLVYGVTTDVFRRMLRAVI